jgi:hypothetical protein
MAIGRRLKNSLDRIFDDAAVLRFRFRSRSSSNSIAAIIAASIVRSAAAGETAPRRL